MANVSLYYEKHIQKVTLNFSHNRTHARRALPIRIDPTQWENGKVVNHPDQKNLNTYLMSILSEAQTIIIDILRRENMHKYTSTRLRDEVCKIMFNEPDKEDERPSVIAVFDMILDKKHGQARARTYRCVRDLVLKYDSKADKLAIDDITQKWIGEFEEFLCKTTKTRRFNDPGNYAACHRKTNTVSSYLACLKAVFNFAVKYEYTDNTKAAGWVELKHEPTMHRDLTIEQLRKIFNYKGTKEENDIIDFFKLTFYLIGINAADLSKLPPDAIVAGRINYIRSKTRKPYSIKVEPEALEIINRHSSRQCLVDFFDNAKTYMSKLPLINRYLNLICARLGIPEVTTYWARHSWSTIAFNELDISQDTISMALGHSFGVRITGTYINKHIKRIDKANREVIDFVLYDKKPKRLMYEDE